MCGRAPGVMRALREWTAVNDRRLPATDDHRRARAPGAGRLRSLAIKRVSRGRQGCQGPGRHSPTPSFPRPFLTTARACRVTVTQHQTTSTPCSPHWLADRACPQPRGQRRVAVAQTCAYALNRAASMTGPSGARAGRPGEPSISPRPGCPLQAPRRPPWGCRHRHPGWRMVSAGPGRPRALGACTRMPMRASRAALHWGVRPPPGRAAGRASPPPPPPAARLAGASWMHRQLQGRRGGGAACLGAARPTILWGGARGSHGRSAGGCFRPPAASCPPPERSPGVAPLQAAFPRRHAPAGRQPGPADRPAHRAVRGAR